MPMAQFLSANVERLLNHVIGLDPDSQARLKKLQGKSLQVRLRELPWPILLQFSQRIDLSIVEQPDDLVKASCMLELNIETLQQLRDSSKLTQLIQEQKLILVGDMYVAQSVSSLFQELHIDWEEELSQYVGDALAHQTFVGARSALHEAKTQIEAGRSKLSAQLLRADGLAVGATELAHFSDEVDQLRSASERLSARLLRLEMAAKVGH
ncbi:MAG: sterol-binding protein [Paraglaciecola sp.]|nr:sterol-binding protein [Paraglaciecola sp.]NCT46658.1 sterol-binding protein [Paraglaciecola sp.]